MRGRQRRAVRLSCTSVEVSASPQQGDALACRGHVERRRRRGGVDRSARCRSTSLPAAVSILQIVRTGVLATAALGLLLVFAGCNSLSQGYLGENAYGEPTYTEIATYQSCDSGRCGVQCPPGERCVFSCKGGGCSQTCDYDGDCMMTCSGGGCVQQCTAGAHCMARCTGGGCLQVCAEGASCPFSCSGGGCDRR
ncbi:MAG: hypothetical protein ACI9MR_001427 [Myxococcota bacterium]|jgi:hypothetical protein